MDTGAYSIKELDFCFPMGKDGTWWRVLQVNAEEKTALVIANKEICQKAYNEEMNDIIWEECTLRKWLNGEYFEETFSDQEKEAILECEIKTPDNVEYGTKGGADTKDKIWLLSEDEASRCFNYDRATGDYWWLRSPGRYQRYAASVRDDGSICDYGYDVDAETGVRPVFLLNLNSPFFKQIFEDEDLKTAKIPEGVTEIPSYCFVEMENLQEVVLPSTLKKIGKEAFCGCMSLKSVTGTNGSISYGKDAFEDCEKLEYTAEMFRNTGKLCDSFAYHMDNCGPVELAWILMYQKGDVWNEESWKKITKNNAGEILDAMTDHIETAKRSPKKAAAAASAFITANCMLLPAEKISRFCDVLDGKKLGELAANLNADPVVAYILGGNDEESSSGKKDEARVDQMQRIMPDGSIWYGKVEMPLAVGSCFCMGNKRTYWRILYMDQEEQAAVVIASRPILYASYDKERGTWSPCSLRHWLNGDYIEKTFSEKEKSAILECDIKTQDNPKYKTKGGTDTKDKIWLLSIDEAYQYFKDNTDRACGDFWWLRSPGYDQGAAACVRNIGSIIGHGYDVNYARGVRPAFKINLKSEFFQSIISISQEGKIVINNPELVIRNGALIEANPGVTEVLLPSFVKEIKEGAFEHCRKLKSLTWEADSIKIPVDAFCHNRKLILPASFYLGSKLPDEEFARYAPAESSVIANMLILASHESAYRSQAIQCLSVNNAQGVSEEILRISAGMLVVKSIDNIMRFLLAAFSCILPETAEKLCEFLNSYKENERGVKIVREALKADSNRKTDVDKDMFEISAKILQTEDTAMKKLPNLLDILAATYDYADMYKTGQVDVSEYKEAALDSYQKHEVAEARAKEMDHAALMQLLKVWQTKVGDEWYAPYAAYADENELADLLKDMKSWMKDRTLKDRVIRVRGAILLNDTNDAMRYADSMGLLDRYAALRGMDVDTVRDSMMSDLGLDETGHKTWTLAGKAYLLTLNKDLSVTLTDESGKVLKSIPKKGADPDEYDAVSKEYMSLKKDIKPTAKLRNDKIFADFLSGETHNGAAWKKAYLKNPLLRLLAQLIVWDQKGHAFILKDDGAACDADGNPYEITDEPIAVAHPMEMGKDLTAKWQDYFVSNSLKQPFEQVWEPVADASLVKTGRYNNCTIPLYALMNKEKHGIIMKGQNRIALKDCSAGLKLVEDYPDWYNNDFEVYDFKFERYTRQVNHIVTLLDKATVAGRIKKDDVSVEQWLDLFTPAQIRDFVTLASEIKATNVTALLLQYQSEHFETEKFDAFDEFTLDLL